VKGRQRRIRYGVGILDSIICSWTVQPFAFDANIAYQSFFLDLQGRSRHSDFRRFQQDDHHQAESVGPNASTSRVPKFLLLHTLGMFDLACLEIAHEPLSSFTKNA
jgi:hypothetical protein